MKELFLPYELAVIAKEKGFNQKCLAYFKEDGLLYSTDGINLTEDKVQAPLYQQIIDWFIKDHSMFIEMGFDFTSEDHKWTCVTMSGLPNPDNIKWHAGSLVFGNTEGNDYYEVYQKGIEEAFKLIS